MKKGRECGYAPIDRHNPVRPTLATHWLLFFLLQCDDVTMYSYGISLLQWKGMAGLQCVCGDVFRAQCDIEPASCGVAYLLLVLSAIAHVMRCCAWCDDEDSDDEECTGTMYT